MRNVPEIRVGYGRVIIVEEQGQARSPCTTASRYPIPPAVPFVSLCPFSRRVSGRYLSGDASKSRNEEEKRFFLNHRVVRKRDSENTIHPQKCS